MISSYHIRLLIEECREMGWSGLNNGKTASMPQIQIDVLKPPHDFLGVQGNPAIFVNQSTYKLLGHLHKNWVMNQTIALKTTFFEQKTIDVIGAIIHEGGHAFNVAAKIANTETNAYIYEIEMMRKLFETKSPLLFGCDFSDIQSFFKGRLAFYNKGIDNKDNSDKKYLASLVEAIKQEFKLEEEVAPSPEQKNSERISIFITGITLFKQKQWTKENEIVLEKMKMGFSSNS
ncbi:MULTISPECIES: hypothetical protein [Legionella]|uniref:Uncharacterized protein n=1 Tax=Legionella resiliens TaxID=2905958 RepID=A0ABS8WWM3_9GAMM|nr:MULTISPECIES: hypothetical protein [unclassified Legionella]MCE0721719.1 hypothetical protein [Legionella sp. 9fVS26]MCE3530873.1 hypothetical protein [Legionella sp. 8cVS16]QLZ70436.1 hypothetical protein FOLKNPGA_03250 [Legionella sp. PC1000]